MVKQSTCASCLKIVGHKANALSCFHCCAKFHISCIHVSVEFYRQMLSMNNGFVQILCDKCQNVLKPVKSNSVLQTAEVPCQMNVTPPITPIADHLPHTSSVADVPSPSEVNDPIYQPHAEVCPWIAQGSKTKGANQNRTRSNKPQTMPTAEQSNTHVRSEAQLAPSTTREHNLMVFHAPESKDSSPQMRYNHDVGFLQDLIDKMLDVGEGSVKIRQLVRLGKNDDQSNRPLRITFADTASVRLILSRLWRLQGSKIHIRRDMEPSDRERLKSAVLELKRRTSEGETSLRIVNFRVVAVKTRINRTITLQARPTIASTASV